MTRAAPPQTTDPDLCDQNRDWHAQSVTQTQSTPHLQDLCDRNRDWHAQSVTQTWDGVAL
jgi:hypothetical protein